MRSFIIGTASSLLLTSAKKQFPIAAGLKEQEARSAEGSASPTALQLATDLGKYLFKYGEEVGQEDINQLASVPLKLLNKLVEHKLEVYDAPQLYKLVDCNRPLSGESDSSVFCMGCNSGRMSCISLRRESNLTRIGKCNGYSTCEFYMQPEYVHHGSPLERNVSPTIGSGVQAPGAVQAPDADNGEGAGEVPLPAGNNEKCTRNTECLKTEYCDKGKRDVDGGTELCRPRKGPKEECRSSKECQIQFTCEGNLYGIRKGTCNVHRLTRAFQFLQP